MISVLGLSLLFFPLNYEARYERNTSTQQIEAVKPQSYSIGLQKNKWQGLLEYDNYTSDSGNSSYTIQRSHRDLLMHLNYDIYQSPAQLNNNFNWNIYLGGALGSYRESVNTTLLGISSTDNGSEKWLMGAVAGVDLKFKYIFFQIEGRSLFGDSFDPQPQFGYIARLGLQIPLGPARKNTESNESSKKLRY